MIFDPKKEEWSNEMLKIFNISNKILIISAMTFFFIAPVLNFKLINEELSNLKAIEMVSIITFCLINIYFFSWQYF